MVGRLIAAGTLFAASLWAQTQCLNDAQVRVIEASLNTEEYAKYIRGTVSYDDYIRNLNNRTADFLLENSRNCTAINLARESGDASGATERIRREVSESRIEQLLERILARLDDIEESLNGESDSEESE